METTLTNDLKEAMKSGDKLKLSVVRNIKAEIKNKEIELGRSLTEDEILAVITKQVKIRKESIEEFKKANRIDLVTLNEDELNILNEYLPKYLSLAEISAIIDQKIEELNAKDAKDMGRVMSALKEELQNKADMSEVSKLTKEKLN